jgi:hypothetical protein
MPVKPSSQLTLHDKLSRLNLVQAKKLLGPTAAALLPKAGQEEIDTASQVLFTADQFQVVFPRTEVVVTLALHPSYRDRLQIACSHEGEVADYHRAALDFPSRPMRTPRGNCCPKAIWKREPSPNAPSAPPRRK